MTTKSRAMGFAGTHRRITVTIAWTPKTPARAWVAWTQNEAGDEKELELVLLDHTFKGKPATLGEVLRAAGWSVGRAAASAPMDRDVS